MKRERLKRAGKAGSVRVKFYFRTFKTGFPLLYKGNGSGEGLKYVDFVQEICLFLIASIQKT